MKRGSAVRKKGMLEEKLVFILLGIRSVMAWVEEKFAPIGSIATGSPAPTLGDATGTVRSQGKGGAVEHLQLWVSAPGLWYNGSGTPSAVSLRLWVRTADWRPVIRNGSDQCCRQALATHASLPRAYSYGLP
jgi:hypothetical protein